MYTNRLPVVLQDFFGIFRKPDLPAAKEFGQLPAAQSSASCRPAGSRRIGYAIVSADEKPHSLLDEPAAAPAQICHLQRTHLNSLSGETSFKFKHSATGHAVRFTHYNNRGAKRYFNRWGVLTSHGSRRPDRYEEYRKLGISKDKNANGLLKKSPRRLHNEPSRHR